MDLIEIPEKKIKVYLPRELSECDTRQYIEMSKLIFGFQIGKISYEHFRIDALYKLLNMKSIRNKNSDKYKTSTIYLLSERIDSFFETNTDGQRVIKQYYLNNPIPFFRANFRQFYGPKNEFDDVTFGEYVDALESFIDFNQTGEFKYLYRLAAILYRKKNLFRRKKHTYRSSNLENRAKLFRHQPVGIIYGIYLYFASFQKWLTTARIYVGGNEIDLSILFTAPEESESNESKIPGLGMKSILFALAESNVFGDFEKTQQASLWNVLSRMYDTAKRNADQEAALKIKKA